jgi:tetratricopeptide (TPR) repeat protein
MSPGQRRRLSNPESQAQYLYEARGESSLALNTYKAWNEVGTNQEEVSLSRQHNLALLAYLEDAQKDTEQAYLTALKELHSNKDNKRDRYSKNKDLSLHELVLAYNLALHSFFSQEYREAEEMIFPIFKNISNNEEDFRYIRYGDIKCKVAFLLVDCILAVFEVDIVDEILDWIEKFIASRPDSAVDETTDGSSYTKESATQLKFRLHCYRARYLFLDSESQNTKFEANTRLARKELKNAMEIYHHQLSGKRSASSSIGDGTTSLQDSVENGSNDVNGEGNISVSNGIKNDIAASSVSNDHRLPFEIKRSEAQNQHVLFLKANLEFVKDHTKKSLKLCSETQNTTDRDKDSNQGDTSSSDEITHIEHAMYNNNVAIVHQAAGQPYLAMHYYSHALSHIEKAQEESDCIKASGIKINSDGTMTKMSVTQLLYNAAMCAKKAGNFFSAYECMSRYIELSPDSVHHPLPWLHLGQSCVGKFMFCSISMNSMILHMNENLRLSATLFLLFW